MIILEFFDLSLGSMDTVRSTDRYSLVLFLLRVRPFHLEFPDPGFKLLSYWALFHYVPVCLIYLAFLIYRCR